MSDETMRLSGAISQYIFDKFCQAIDHPVYFGREKFRLAYAEEAEELGYDDDDDVTLVVRRESDGAYFEVELEATARPVPTAEERAEAAKHAERLRQALAERKKRDAEAATVQA